MITLIPDKNWSVVQVTVPNEIAIEVESYAEEPVDQQYILCGAILYNLIKMASEAGRNDFFEGLTGAIEYMARIHGATEEDVTSIRSSLWKSAHNFVVSATNTVDRGREVEELAKVLRSK